MQKLTEAEIRKQSENCYNQWAKQWRAQAKYHGERFEMHSLNELHQIGVGKAVLCVANGYSFEENIETIKKHQDKVDIVACDKTIGSLIKHGITPKYCILCDANVSFEKYMEPYKDKVKDTVLISNVCAATKWASCDWKKVYFFINQDVLQSEREFSEISGCNNIVVAGTNVSNAMVILLTQCNNDGFNNFFGYDKILLIGFDYCWDDNYYAFDADGDGKVYYMKGMGLVNMDGDFCYSSPNLIFSARWFDQYCKTFKLPVIQCSKRSIVQCGATGKLEEQMQYSYNQEDSAIIRKLVKLRTEAFAKIKDIDAKMANIAYDHHLAFQRSI